jgi:NDP-sugar pyrophosphorylase family protein
MLKQIIVAAGGIGSRMSPSINCHRSKALIEYEGKPLIYYLLASAKQAGIGEFFISVNEHNKSRIEKVAESLGLDYKTRITGPSFRHVPELFRELLEDRVLIACGHQVITKEHFQKMFDAAKEFDDVFSAYHDPPYTTDKRKRVLAHGIGTEDKLQFRMVDLDKDEVQFPLTYVKSPYIVTVDMIDKVREGGFEKAAGFYMFKHWEAGGNVTAIDSGIPPEFDYDHEFQRTKTFLEEYFKKSGGVLRN